MAANTPNPIADRSFSTRVMLQPAKLYGAADILAQERFGAALVLQVSHRPADELIDRFVACPDQGAHPAFRIGCPRRALHAETALRDEAAVAHHRGPQAHHRPALSRRVEHLRELVELDPQRIPARRAVGALAGRTA